MSQVLRVVTPAKWLADDLAAAAPDDLRIVQDLGLDLDPADAPKAFWWCPQRHAIRLVNSGVDPRFTAPGPHFTEHLEYRFRGRHMVACILANAETLGSEWAHRPVHAKLAEAKLNAVPAAVYPDLGAFLSAAEAAGLPRMAMVQLSEPVEMVTEARCWILDRTVVAASVYLDHGVTWDGFEESRDTGWAVEFAGKVVENTGWQPRAFTLDVARLADDGLVVVEANPAWSSNPYYADPAAVIDCILASQHDKSQTHQWGWQPDPAMPNFARHTLEYRRRP